MANIKLYGNTWDSSNIYDEVEGKTQKEVNAAKANTRGNYSELTVGTAEQITSSNGVVDKVPYSLRKTGDGASYVGNRLTDKLVGGSIVWNQQLVNGNFANVGSWEKVESNITVQDNIVTITKALKNPSFLCQVIPFNDHVYFASAELKGANAYISFVRAENGNEISSRAYTTSNDSFARVCFLGKRTNTDANRFVIRDSQSDPGSVYYAKNVCLFDVTQMFGSTIANYIYSLETATAGAGVAFFRSLFPKSYYAYNTGTIMSVQASSHETVGFNQAETAIYGTDWFTGNIGSSGGIEAYSYCAYSKLIRVFPNTEYYMSLSKSSNQRGFAWYDSNGKFIKRDSNPNVDSYFSATSPNNAYYMRWCINHDASTTVTQNIIDSYNICVNLSDPAKNGAYKPYAKYVYPLDDSLTLRGILKLDSNNKLYYDGDTYESDGTVTRKYGAVDLGTLTWKYISDGTFYATISGLKTAQNNEKINAICSKYLFVTYNELNSDTTTAQMCGYPGDRVYIRDTTYSDAATFRTAMSGVYFVYELANPTVESASPYANPQICDLNGTEEYTDVLVLANNRDVSIPVGHETTYHEDYVGKTAENIKNVSDAAESGLLVDHATDFVPYVFRASGSKDSGGAIAVDKLVGGTVVWNQLARFTSDSIPSAADGITYTTDDNNSVTLNGTATVLTSRGGWFGLSEAVNLTEDRLDHKYIFTTKLISGTVTNGEITFGVGGNVVTTLGTTVIKTLTKSGATTIRVALNVPQGCTCTNAKITINFIDLTQMLGSTIADYIHSIETATAGSGVAYFRSLFPNSYYAYNTGTLMSVNAASHETVGKNLFDVNNFTMLAGYSGQMYNDPASRGVVYSVNNGIISVQRAQGSGMKLIVGKFKAGDVVSVSCKMAPTWALQLFTKMDGFPFSESQNSRSLADYSTSNKTVTIPVDGWLAVRQYDSTQSSTFTISELQVEYGSEVTAYEPFDGHTYPLDSTLTLRGLPKLDSNNKLYYDGDTYASDGTVTRKYGIIDLGTLTYTKSSGITNGFVTIDGMPNNFPVAPSVTATPNWITSVGYGIYTNSGIEASGVDRAIAWRVASGQKGVIVRDSTYSSYYTGNDMASFKTAMSGVYLVYELATPTTESAVPFANPQVVDPSGTEEYVDAGVLTGERDVSIPVGHETKYQVAPSNLVRAAKGIVAPVLYEMKADTALVANDLRIVGNQLYRITTPVASGATLTPGTNCTATTVAALIKSLL